jgi:hypothetical protein
MSSRLRQILFLLLLLSKANLYAQRSIKTDILVVGGGTGGIAAGIQAARMGILTTIVESTTMLGGMLTAAGVSCTDGNDSLPSGIWQEFRQALYKHYRVHNLSTGWVSETCFEPHVGDSIFKSWAAKERKLQVLYQWHFSGVTLNNNRIETVYFTDNRGMSLTVSPMIIIDATELGDVFAAAGVSYDLGTEDPALSTEKMAPGKTDIIQDLTWVAVLKDYGPGKDMTIPKPRDYDPSLYYCCCTSAPCQEKAYAVDAKGMLNYALLPNKKFMLNWPAHGNDYYLNVIEEKAGSREKKYQLPKERTLGFIYFIQTTLGFRNLGLAKDELDHGLALIPYNREGRRMKGIVRLNVNQLSNPFDQYEKLYRTAISVGDYPVDHHHSENPGTPIIKFPSIPSFSIPMGALIPQNVNNLIVCDKGISVSNIVNGATRLQPVVLLTGQAAGAMAAVAIMNKVEPHQLDVRFVQSALLDAHCFLMPYVDVLTSDPAWASIQRIGCTGILKGTGKPSGWANRTYFYPSHTISHNEFVQDFGQFDEEIFSTDDDSLLTIENACSLAQLYQWLHTNHSKKVLVEESGVSARKIWEQLGLSGFDSGRAITRRELAILLDQYAHVFENTKVDIYGFYEKH